MEKQELKKNRLDLEYHHESQKANTFLILLTSGTIGFIGTFIWLNNSFFMTGAVITLLVTAIGFIAYILSLNRMREILSEIENIQ